MVKKFLVSGKDLPLWWTWLPVFRKELCSTLGRTRQDINRRQMLHYRAQSSDRTSRHSVLVFLALENGWIQPYAFQLPLFLNSEYEYGSCALKKSEPKVQRAVGASWKSLILWGLVIRNVLHWGYKMRSWKQNCVSCLTCPPSLPQEWILCNYDRLGHHGWKQGICICNEWSP